MNFEVAASIARLRRNMSRNPDVMAVCDEVERLVRRPPIPPDPPQLVSENTCTAAPKFDRNAYQRDYMRKRRAERRTP